MEVVQRVPEVPLIPVQLAVSQSFNGKLTVCLPDTQQQSASVSVRERGVGLPDAVWQSARRQLAFKPMAFFEFSPSGPETHAEPARKARRTSDETKLMALKLLEESGSMSSSELARALGYNRPTETLSKIIKELLELGLVEYVIPGSKYNRNQKLRKTNKGSPAASAGKAEA